LLESEAVNFFLPIVSGLNCDGRRDSAKNLPDLVPYPHPMLASGLYSLASLQGGWGHVSNSM
jgi:hypothetical protein